MAAICSRIAIAGNVTEQRPAISKKPLVRGVLMGPGQVDTSLHILQLKAASNLKRLR